MLFWLIIVFINNLHLEYEYLYLGLISYITIKYLILSFWWS